MLFAHGKKDKSDNSVDITVKVLVLIVIPDCKGFDVLLNFINLSESVFTNFEIC